MLSLKDKVAVITGGSRGIGLATAKIFLKLGAKVAIWDLNQIPTDTLNALKLIYSKDNVMFIQCDVRKDDDVKNATNLSIDKFKTVDILVNNASSLYINGIDGDFELWQDSLNVNLIGAARCCRCLFPYLKQQPYNSIVNIGSDSILTTRQHFLTYSTAKAALLNLTKSLAVDYKDYKIKVNMVSPGTVFTPYLQEFAVKMGYSTELEFFDNSPDFGGKTLYNRIALPEEIANVISFLASDLSNFINGSNIPVDAGSTIL